MTTAHTPVEPSAGVRERLRQLAGAWQSAHKQLRDHQRQLAHAVDNTGDYWRGPAGDAMRAQFEQIHAELGKLAATLEDAEETALRCHRRVIAAHDRARQAVGAAHSAGCQVLPTGEVVEPTGAEGDSQLHADRVTAAFAALRSAVDDANHEVHSVFAEAGQDEHREPVADHSAQATQLPPAGFPVPRLWSAVQLRRKRSRWHRRPAAPPAPLGDAAAVPSAYDEPDALPAYDAPFASKRAIAIVADLVAQSGAHPGIEWAVGAYEFEGNVEYFAAGNEGCGYLPRDLFWDSSVKLVVHPGHSALANPARLVAEHYASAHDQGVARLVAIASSVPVGVAVADFAARHHAETATAPPVPAKSQVSERIHRLDLAQPAARLHTAAVPADRRHAAGCAVMFDAVQRSGLGSEYPHLERAASDLRDGMPVAAD
ncbi:MAG: WXG100 family type VII secretion target, partial [Mycobacteriaceae bacterium]|nr:WXG100 family type VII secretion target [Mycobacteriaceae bacterium]